MPPVSRSPSHPPLAPASPEASTSSSTGRDSPASVPAKLGFFRGSPDRSLSNPPNLAPNERDKLGTSRGSPGSRRPSTVAAERDFPSRPLKTPAHSPSSSGSPGRPNLPRSAKTSPKPPVNPHLSRSQSLDSEYDQPAPKPPAGKTPGLKPPRPSPPPSSPRQRHVDADVSADRSPRQPTPKPQFGLWSKGGVRAIVQNPVGLFASRRGAANPLPNPSGNPSPEATAVVSGRAANGSAAQSQRVLNPALEARSAVGAGQNNEAGFGAGKRAAVPAPYHRESQDAQVLNVKARAGLSPEAKKERKRRELNDRRLGEAQQAGAAGGHDSPLRAPPSPETGSDLSSMGSPFTPRRLLAARTPPITSGSLSDVSNSLDDLSAALQSFSIGRRGSGNLSSGELRGGLGAPSSGDGSAGRRGLDAAFEAASPYWSPSPGNGGSAEALLKSPVASGKSSCFILRHKSVLDVLVGLRFRILFCISGHCSVAFVRTFARLFRNSASLPLCVIHNIMHH